MDLELFDEDKHRLDLYNLMQEPVIKKVFRHSRQLNNLDIFFTYRKIDNNTYMKDIKHLWWAIMKDNIFIGFIGLHTVIYDLTNFYITIAISSKYTRLGYAKIVITEACKYLFNERPDIDYIYADVNLKNKSSMKLMESLGLSIEKDWSFHGVPHRRYVVSRSTFK